MASWTASSPGGRADFPLCILRESFDNSSLLNTFGEHGGTAHADTMEELSSSNGSRMVVVSFIVTNRTDKIANKAAELAAEGLPGPPSGPRLGNTTALACWEPGAGGGGGKRAEEVDESR
eukprot:768304-Hanusia_phi.AAC.2